MVVSKPLLIVMLLGVAACAGGSVWLFGQSGRLGHVASGSTESDPLGGDEARKRAKTFFRGRQDYDLTGGQEMRPRW